MHGEKNVLTKKNPKEVAVCTKKMSYLSNVVSFFLDRKSLGGNFMKTKSCPQALYMTVVSVKLFHKNVNERKFLKINNLYTEQKKSY